MWIFELYLRKDISWKEKVDIYLKTASKYVKVFGEDYFNHLLKLAKFIKENYTDEGAKSFFEGVKSFAIFWYRFFEYTSVCRCGNKTEFEVMTYANDVPIKIEFLCEKCFYENYKDRFNKLTDSDSLLPKE
jgi:hypothetical protein